MTTELFYYIFKISIYKNEYFVSIHSKYGKWSSEKYSVCIYSKYGKWTAEKRKFLDMKMFENPNVMAPKFYKLSF